MAEPATSPNDSAPSKTIELLSISNQVAPRSFVYTAFCFALDGDCDTYKQVYDHSRTVLDDVARDHPFLAGKIVQDPSLHPDGQQGRFSLSTEPSDSIPLTCEFDLDKFGWTYEELKDKGFPQGAFVGTFLTGSDDDSTAQNCASVMKVSLTFIHGGLIMVVRNHHSLIDGGARKRLFDCLATYTRKQPYEAPMVLTQQASNSRIEELLEKYRKTGPCEPNFLTGGIEHGSIEMSGKIFQFSDTKIKELRALLGADAIANQNVLFAVQQQPSIYMTLAALAWAHVTRARLETERNASNLNNEGQATLMTPVSWKSHALKEGNEHYFGNAVATVFTNTSISQLLRACVDIRGLSELIRRINDTVKSVDEEYMNKRIALYKKIPDFRRLGLNFDIRNPQEYTFNTWRWFGGGTEWNIPGVASGKADAIRRVTTSHKLGAIVILPAPSPTADQELYIELPKISMERLCKDGEWMRWIHKVVE